MRGHALAILVVVAVGATGCSAGNDSESSGYADVAGAEEAFVACAEAHGAGVEELEVGRDGVELLLFTSDTRRGLYDTVAQECEQAVLEVLGAGSPSSPVPAVPAVPDGVTTLPDYFAYLDRQGFVGAVLVGDGADVSESAAFGMADRASAAPLTIDTAFDVGSITKNFTMVAVLRAVDAGVLSLDATLGQIFDVVPDDKAGITVEQLLTHRSGLDEYHDAEGDFEPMSREQALDAIFGKDLRFAPGSDRAYSNSGFTLLAAAVEETSGRSFEEVLEELFELADMRHSGFYGSDRLQDAPVATGYEGRTFGANSPDSWPRVSWALMGAGGVASSVEDLHRWIDALRDGTLLDDEMRGILYERILETAEVIPGVDLVGYAGGNDFGFEVTIVELLEHDQHVVVATNHSAPSDQVTTEVALILTQLLVDV